MNQKCIIKLMVCCLCSILVSVSGHRLILAESNSVKPFSILLLGIDTGEEGREDTGRSDVMVVAVVNPAKAEVNLVSIPRDSLVSIEGLDHQDKLNHAYAIGGTKMAKQTISKLLDIPIEYTATVNMGELEQLVEAVGGVTVIPPSTFDISGYTFFEGEPTILDGSMALAYVRERYESGGDYARQERQRQLMTAIVNKLMADRSTLTMTSLLRLSSIVKTDLPIPFVLNLLEHLPSQGFEFKTLHLSGSGTTINKVYYEQLDTASLKQVVQQLKQALK